MFGPCAADNDIVSANAVNHRDMEAPGWKREKRPGCILYDGGETKFFDNLLVSPCCGWRTTVFKIIRARRKGI